MDDTSVFGSALLEAYTIENSQAVYPRVVLSKAALGLVRQHIGYYGDKRGAPQNSEVLIDSDGHAFLNCLEAALLDNHHENPSYGIAELGAHRDAVVKMLATHKSNAKVFDKYRWVGQYHNYVARALFPDEPELQIAVDALLTAPSRLVP